MKTEKKTLYKAAKIIFNLIDIDKETNSQDVLVVARKFALGHGARVEAEAALAFLLDEQVNDINSSEKDLC